MTSVSTVSVGSIELRLAEPADQAFLEHLYETTRLDISSLGWPPEITRAFVVSQFEAQSQHYRRVFPEACDQIVVVDGEAVGRLLVERSGGVVRVVDIALLPTHRGRGIGDHLLQAVCAQAAQEGAAVRLSVAVGNRAEKLYERLGFEVIDRDPMYQTMEWRAA